MQIIQFVLRFPEKWKDANLVPIHKCESKIMVSNYRGISLLDVLSKILERLVYNEIFSVIYLPASLPTGSMNFYQKNPLCLNYFKLFINWLMLLRGDNKLMLFF